MSSKQTRKLKKPRLLAYAQKGDYGDIHYPTLPCKDPGRTPKPEENYISKSMMRSRALQEIRATSEWRKRNFDFALVPEEICEGEGTLREGEGKTRKSLRIPRYLLISKYGGLTAREISHDLIDQAKRTVKYLNALVKLRENVKEMNKEHFFHNDITDLNITYDEAKGKAFLIDFEYADREVKQPSSNLRSNNSFRQVNINDETVFIDNTINYFLDSLRDIGLDVKGMKSSPRRRSRTLKTKRPHSV
jgi:tRNA A-37 threonylcarbamoyl transferase component Bud32